MGRNIHGHSFSKHLNTLCKVLRIRGQGADEQAQIVACGAVTTMANAVCVGVQAGGRCFLLQTCFGAHSLSPHLAELWISREEPQAGPCPAESA